MSKCENLPADLRENGRFCLWKYEERDGRQAKVPYNPITGERVRANDPNTFSDFATAERVLEHRPERFQGLGIGLFGDMVGVDIDHCMDEAGTLSPLARDVVELLDSYTERSPSGTGLHILCRAPGFAFDPARYYTKNSGLGLEVYVAGQTSRYLTVTGDVVHDTPIRTCPEALQVLLDRYMRRSGKAEGSGEILVNYKELARAAGVDVHTGNTWSDTPVDNTAGTTQEREEAALLDDAEVLDRMLRSAKGANIAQLWAGEWEELGFSSQSEADLALCNHLAFFTNRDAAQMDRLFRQSGLMRDKWDRPQSGSTYGGQTLQRALRDCKTTWNPQFRSGQGLTGGVARAVEFLRGVDLAHSREYRRDDLGAGQLLADFLKPLCRPVPERGGWYVYNGRRWKQDLGGAAVAENTKNLARALSAYAAEISDDEDRDKLLAWARLWTKSQSRQTFIREAASCWPISLSEFDRDPWLLNCLNGTLDLRTRELRPHDPEDRITMLANVEYTPSARCERWERFVREVMEPQVGEAGQKESTGVEKAEYLQRVAGYCLSGSTKEECMFVLFGPSTRNGKSTFLGVMQELLGDYAKAAAPETVANMGFQDGTRPSGDVARLAGARLVALSEFADGAKLDAALVKGLTGNDTIVARHLYGQPFEFAPSFKLVAGTNHLPAVADSSVFESHRIRVIRFDRHFHEDEQDKNLKAELRRPESLSGVLNWALCGLSAYMERGLEEPEAVRTAVDEYQRSSDRIAEFVGEVLEQDTAGEERLMYFYALYKDWALENGQKPYGSRAFAQGLERLGIHSVRGRPRNGGSPTTLVRGYRATWAG